MTTRPAVLLASSRSDSNTRALADIAFPLASADFFDLSVREIGYYDYDNRNHADDFLPLI